MEPYGGVMMKVLKHMQRGYNLTYEIRRAPDRTWGHKNANGTWNGMIKVILGGEIDFSIGMPPYLISKKEKYL